MYSLKVIYLYICMHWNVSTDLCLCFVGATFSVEGGHAKGQRTLALLRSPLFPPPLRNSPCTVRKLCITTHRHPQTQNAICPIQLLWTLLGFSLHPKISVLTGTGVTEAGVLPRWISYSHFGDFRCQTAGSKPLEMSIFSTCSRCPYPSWPSSFHR